MGTLQINDFKYGIDRRRERVAGVAGTLWVLDNAVLTRGGDIERAKKFVPAYTLPAGTFGLSRLGDQLWVFGSQVDPGMPFGVIYSQLSAPASANMVEVLDAKQFLGANYVIARFDDGNIYHFYSGSRVTDWDTVAAANSNYNTLAQYFSDLINLSADVTAKASVSTIQITANTPGTPFTLSAAAVDKGSDATQSATVSTTVANVAAVQEVRATGTVTITGGSFGVLNKIGALSVGGVDLINSPVGWVSDNASTANALATAINNQTGVHGYKALASGAVVTITAATGTGSAPNGATISISLGGNVTALTSGTMSGGVDAVAAVAQVSKVTFGGTYEPVDQFTITLNGDAYVATGLASGTGIACRPHQKRMWTVVGTQLIGSKLNDASDFSDTSTSSGYVVIDVSSASEGTGRLLGLGVYTDYLAVFSRSQIRLYSITTDATTISFYQELANTGALAGLSIVTFGNADTFYLSSTGVRSIRTRSQLNLPSVSDIGEALDTYIRSKIISLPEGTVRKALGAIEPVDGRFWLAMGSEIYVLSYFEASKVTAWSVLKPGFEINGIARIDDNLYVRSGDTVYLYGGAQSTTYPDADESVVTFETPFLSANHPSLKKLIGGFDIGCLNTWEMSLYVDPNDETRIVPLGVFYETTYSKPDAATPVEAAVFAFKGVCREAGRATVSGLALHFKGESAEV